MTKRELILEEALSEFCENDYKNASVNQIIAKAGSSKGTFYYYFKDKEDLYITLVKEAFQKKMKVLSSIHTDDFFEFLMWQAKSGIAFSKEYPRYYLLSRQFAKEVGNPIFQRILGEVSGQSGEDQFAKQLERAYLNNQIHPDFPKEFVAKMVASLLDVLNDWNGKECMSIEQMEEKLLLIIQVLERGIRNAKD